MHALARIALLGNTGPVDFRSCFRKAAKKYERQEEEQAMASLGRRRHFIWLGTYITVTQMRSGLDPVDSTLR